MSPERRQMDGVVAALSELLGGLWMCFVCRRGALCCFLTGWWGLGGSARTARPPGGGGAAAFVSEFECVHEVKGANQRPWSYSLGVTVQHGPARPRLFERLHNSRVFPH